MPESTGYERFLWLRGCILLLPSYADERAEAGFKEDQAGGGPPRW